jgi:hypothetical protein
MEVVMTDKSRSHIELRFIGEKALIDSLADELRTASPESVKSVSTGKVEEPTDLRLTIGEVADLVTVVSFMFFSGPLVPMLLRVFRESQPQPIIIESALGRVTFEPSKALTEDELREVLDKLVDLFK